MLTQLIVTPIGVTTILHGGELVGIPLAACGLVGLVGLFAPSTTSAIEQLTRLNRGAALFVDEQSFAQLGEGAGEQARYVHL